MLVIILNAVFCLSFILFAYLNLNDSDAWKWVPIYLFAAACCGLAAFQKFYPIAYLCAISVYLAFAVFLFFARDGVWDWITKYNKPNIVESMQVTKPYIEKTREFFGLLIISGALLFNYLLAT